MKVQSEGKKLTNLLWIFSFMVFVIFYSNQIKAQPLPKAIYNTGEAAEDLVDYAQSANWSKVKLKIDEINKLYNSYRSEVIHNKLSLQLLDFYSYYVERLNNGLSLKHGDQIAFAANQITGIGVDFENHFNHKIPPEVSRLDYLGRELLLEGRDNNSIAVNRRLGDIDETWAGLKSVIISKHGFKQAMEFELLVSKIKSLKNKLNSDEFKQTVNKYSDQIDKLEKLF
ncbi:MAG: hypothetical protein ACYCVH_06815 [Ignavibacteriaceae bacterium]